ncbi:MULTISPECIES: helix-turn-helix domain-containing protein [Anoxybacillaceae]|uniref:helix-turn-helix domain-containing protein n=1 Tax=Anoxybacillaceae TaxID=3120669 RepID=UPI0020D068B2|nr:MULTISPECIES: helix-turn-helix transcriptional regulator [Bacillaceae]
MGFLSFGSNVRYFRIQKKMTLQELSKKLGVSVNYLSKLEQDSAKIKPDFLPKLCAALEIDLSELYREDLPDIEKL